MENKINRNKTKIVITSIIVILILMIFSNVVNSSDSIPIQDIVRVEYATELAAVAAYAPEEFLGYTPGELFVLNARGGGKGLAVGHPDGTGTYEIDKGGAVYYKTTICMYHQQGTIGDARIMIGNIIDIEAPGQVVVYKFVSAEEVTTGTIGQITQSGNTITEIAPIVRSGKDEIYKVKYTKTVLNLSDTQMHDFAATAYLAYKSLYSEAADKELDFGPEKHKQASNRESALYWYWKTKLKGYIPSGVLDNHFAISDSAASNQEMLQTG